MTNNRGANADRKNEPMTTKRFPRAVVWSVVSGKLLCEFSKMHECVNHMNGAPVWNHGLGYWCGKHEGQLNKLFPDLVEAPGITPETFLAFYEANREYLEELVDVPVIGNVEPVL